MLRLERDAWSTVKMTTNEYAPPPRAQCRGWSGNQAALLWHRTRFLSFWAGFGVVLAFFVLPTPPRSVPGRGLGNRAIKLWHTTVGFSQYFVFCPADPPRSEPGAIWVIWLLRLVWHRAL